MKFFSKTIVLFKLIIRNFIPLVRRLAIILYHYKMVKYSYVSELYLESKKSTNNNRTLKFKYLTNVFLIRINELYIPIFNDGT